MEEKKSYRRVACELCKRKFLRITNTHLWRAHRLTTAQYLEKFPGAELEDPLLAADRVDSLPEESNYRKRAFEFYGEQCQLCGEEPEDLSDLFVHHRDGNHADAAGNHSLEDLLVVCRSCHADLHRKSDGKFYGLSHFEKGIIYVLNGMRQEFGIDVADENFKDTPKRFARALNEILSGARDTEAQIEKILASSFDSNGFDQFLVANGIVVPSLCPHHLLPVRYVISIGYLPGPGGRVLGLSKLPRLAEVLAARPVLQETVTREIASFLMEKAKAAGAAVIVRGEHSCIWARGVKKDCKVVTSVMLGAFREDPSSRMEILRLMKENSG